MNRVRERLLPRQYGAAIDSLTDQLLEAGLELKDIHELEHLANPRVLHALPGGPRSLQKGNRRDAALYMRTWAGLLELELKARPANTAAAR